MLKKSKAGRIVNVSSILGSLAVNADQNSGWSAVKPFAYNASKAALNIFTVSLSQSLAETGIKVNSAHPGWVKTDLRGANGCERRGENCCGACLD
ncbi:SDR family NAD(P)-dependent oxidoreductase [Microbulbifer sp. THAF38]|uniref:SDR family NAD(P)-dependent oxidoreductase n=1 Tax=Microbulbifer sp. THAF38 TaxID=2587856 RepID=UPI00352ADB82